jgi:WD40 repeat protein
MLSKQQRILTTTLLCLAGIGLGACAASAPPPASEPAALAADGNPHAAPALLPAATPAPTNSPRSEIFPPLPARILDGEKIDFRTLSEPPTLVTDTVGHSSKVKSLVYSEDGRNIVSVGYDKTIRVWSATTGELERTLRGEIGAGPAGRYYAGALSGGDKYLAVAGWLGNSNHAGASSAYQIRVHDFASGTVTRLLSGHSDVVLALAFEPHGQRLCSAGADGKVLLFNAETGQQLGAFFGHSGRVLSVAWSPDRNYIVTGGADRNVMVFNVSSRSEVARFSGHEDGVTGVGFTADGRQIVSASADRSVRLWDAPSGKQVRTLARLASGVGSLTLSPKRDRAIVTSTEAPFESVVLSLPDGKLVTKNKSHDNVVLASAISPSGNWVATMGGSTYALSIWDPKSGAESVRGGGHGAPVWNVGISDDGRAFGLSHEFTASTSGDAQLNGPLAHRLAFSDDKRELVFSEAGDVAGLRRAIAQSGLMSLKLPPNRNGSLLEVWEAGKRRVSIDRTSTSGYSHLSYTLVPTENLVISGGENGALGAYSASSGAQVRDFVGHTGDVLAVAVSGDGKRLVSGSADQTLRVWDVPSGRLLVTLLHARNGEWVTFTPAGYFGSSLFGDGYLGWHINRGDDKAAGFLSATSLERRLRYPSVVAKYLENGGQLEPAVKLANAERPAGDAEIPIYRFETLPQFSPPHVFHLNPGLRAEARSDRIEVIAEAFSPTDEPVSGLEIFVNGRPIDRRWFAKVGAPKLTLDGRFGKIRAIVPLPERLNRISVVPSNAFAAGPAALVDVARTSGPGELEKMFEPGLYVLSIGVSEYENLRYSPNDLAQADAKAIEARFKAKKARGYSRYSGRVLTGNQATADNIRKAFAWLRAEASQRDTSVVFLAGHATRDEKGMYYFLPFDAGRTNQSDKGLPFSELETLMRDLPGRVVLLADTCHAGAISPSDASLRPYDLSRVLTSGSSLSEGVVLLTAASGYELSYEDPSKGHGAFTAAVLEALDGKADRDGDSLLLASELAAYVRLRVPATTLSRQHPTIHVPYSLFDFALTELPPIKKPTSSSKKKP